MIFQFILKVTSIFMFSISLINLVALAQPVSSALLEESQSISKKLGAYEKNWASKGDLKAGFANLHQCVTNGITEKARANGFSNNDWILQLSNSFANRFFTVVRGYEQGSGNLPTAWKQAFEISESIQKDPTWPGSMSPSTAQERVALSFVGAHIFNDITLSLNEIGCTSKKDFQALEPILDSCERQNMGPLLKGLKDAATLMGIPGANAVKDWRNAVWSYVCEGGPHPSKVFN